MKKLLHIIATPRGDDSRTLKVSNAFLDSFHKNHEGFEVDELELFAADLPELTVERVDGKYMLLSGKELTSEAGEAWGEIVDHIERFKSADLYLISTPMWNFSIPYKLKHYIDIIVQPKYLFQYTVDGDVEGLIEDKKMVVIASRGGDYSEGDPNPFDHQEPYLRTVFGFIGLTDIEFIVAEPMDAAAAEVQAEKLDEACERATEIASYI